MASTATGPDATKLQLLTAIAGYLMYRRAPSRGAILLLAAYSGSGLIGFAHYSVDGAFEMPWWRQLHIVADILCGLAIFGFALWAARRRPA